MAKEWAGSKPASPGWLSTGKRGWAEPVTSTPVKDLNALKLSTVRHYAVQLHAGCNLSKESTAFYSPAGAAGVGNLRTCRGWLVLLGCPAGPVMFAK